MQSQDQNQNLKQDQGQKQVAIQMTADAAAAHKPMMRAAHTSQEKSPTTQAPAASSNTATAIAGLKPWSKDWVTEGRDQSPDLKPLFDRAPQATQDSAGKVLDKSKAVSQPVVRPEHLTPGVLEQLRGEAGADFSVSPEVNQMKHAPEGHAETMESLMAKFTKDAAATDGVRVTGMSESQNLSQAQHTEQRNGQTLPMSGAEFLTTLSGVRSDTASQKQAGFGEGSSYSGGQGRGNEQGSDNPMASRLRVINGGASGNGNILPNVASRESMTAEDKPLRAIKGRSADSGSDEFLAALGGKQSMSHTEGAVLKTAGAPVMAEVTGHVTKGAMSQDRLSSQSLTSISTEIRNFTSQGGGEMRIRLNPQNLGELHVRVTTQGQNVGLQIRATDERAKKVIEESMSHLKESLAGQSLTLTKVDLSVAQPGATADQQNAGQNQGQQSGQNIAQNWMSQDRGQSYQGRQDQNGGNASAAVQGFPGASSGVQTASNRSQAAVANGRIDVIA